MTETDSRALLAPGAFLLSLVAGLLVWLLVLAVAGPESRVGDRMFSEPLFTHTIPAVTEGSGWAALARSGLWLHLFVTALAFFLAGLVIATAMPAPSAPPVVFGLATAPVLLPLLFLLLAPAPVGRGRSGSFLYYCLVFQAVFGAATFFPAWGGARLAELRRALLHGARRRRVHRAPH